MKKIGLIILILILLIFNFIIGANEKGLRIQPISAMMAVTILYLIIYKIKNRKENIVFKSKVDYFVFGFMCVTFLPLVFHTYASFSDTIEFIMKYFFIYSVYVLARNVLTEKKYVEVLISCTLIFSIIPIVLEFDYLHLKIFEGFMEWMNIIYKPEAEFSGTFGYANAQAVYLALCLFLTIHKFSFNQKKVLKVLDVIYIVFCSYFIFATQAKWIIFAIALILIVLIAIKYRKFIASHKIWFIIFGIFGVVGIIVFMIIALRTPGEIVKDGKEAEVIVKYNFEEGKTYKFDLDLKTLCYEDIEKYRDTYAFKVQVLEGNKYFNEFLMSEQLLENYDGNIEIEYTAKRTTDFVRIKIKNNCEGYIKVRSCKINGEDYIIKYKLIPNEVGYMFSGFIFNGQSLRQRLYFYSDSIKIAKISPIVGNGGDAWRNLCSVVQDFPYEVKETHSYFFELLISYGIIGVIAFLSFIGYLFIKVVKTFIKDKEIRKEKLFIFIGLFIILIHSVTFDFDMSFMIIQLLVYVFTAVLLYDEETKVKQIKFSDIAVIILLSVVLSLYIRANAAYFIKDNLIEKHDICSFNKSYAYSSFMIKADVDININYKSNLEETKEFIDKEPYYAQIKVMGTYFKLIYSNLEELSEEEIKDYLEFGINKLSTVKLKKQKNMKDLLNRTYMIVLSINNLEDKCSSLEDKSKKQVITEECKKLREILTNETDENIDKMHDIEGLGIVERQAYEYEASYRQILGMLK